MLKQQMMFVQCFILRENVFGAFLFLMQKTITQISDSEK